MKYRLLLYLAIIANSSHIHSNENIVETDSGITYGYIKNGTINWDDIPYAMPPIKDLRWKAPRNIKITSQVIESKENNFCVQQAKSGMGGLRWRWVGFLAAEGLFIS